MLCPSRLPFPFTLTFNPHIAIIMQEMMTLTTKRSATVPSIKSNTFIYMKTPLKGHCSRMANRQPCLQTLRAKYRWRGPHLTTAMAQVTLTKDTWRGRTLKGVEKKALAMRCVCGLTKLPEVDPSKKCNEVYLVMITKTYWKSSAQHSLQPLAAFAKLKVYLPLPKHDPSKPGKDQYRMRLGTCWTHHVMRVYIKRDFNIHSWCWLLTTDTMRKSGVLCYNQLLSK